MFAHGCDRVAVCVQSLTANYWLDRSHEKRTRKEAVRRLMFWLTPLETENRKRNLRRRFTGSYKALGNLARTYAVHGDGAGLDVEAAHAGGCLN